MLDELHLVCCCGRDEGFLRSFITAWRAVWGGAGSKLVLASDVIDPVLGDYGVETVELQWARSGPIAPGVVRTFQKALAQWPARWVFKHDADIIHLGKRWFHPGAGHLFAGARNGSRPPAVFGGCWGMDARLMTMIDADRDWHGERYEDVAMTRAVIEIMGGRCISYAETQPRDQSPIRGAGSLERYAERWGDACDMLHSGEHGKSQAGREHSQRWQEAVVRQVYG